MSVWRRVDLWNCRASVCLSVRLSVRSIIRPPHAAAAGLLLWARRPADIDRFLHGRRSAANASNVTCSARKLNTQTCHCRIISSNLWVLFLCPRRPSYRPPGHYVFVLFVRLRACVYARRGEGSLTHFSIPFCVLMEFAAIWRCECTERWGLQETPVYEYISSGHLMRSASTTNLSSTCESAGYELWSGYTGRLAFVQ